MACSNNRKIISKASPHTIMKFKLVEEYIKAWAQKLMLNAKLNPPAKLGRAEEVGTGVRK